MLIFAPVDWSGRCETPAGGRDKGDPAGAKAPRRLPDRPWKASNLERESTVMFNRIFLKRGFLKSFDFLGSPFDISIFVLAFNL